MLFLVPVEKEQCQCAIVSLSVPVYRSAIMNTAAHPVTMAGITTSSRFLLKTALLGGFGTRCLCSHDSKQILSTKLQALIIILLLKGVSKPSQAMAHSVMSMKIVLLLQSACPTVFARLLTVAAQKRACKLTCRWWGPKFAYCSAAALFPSCSSTLMYTMALLVEAY